MKNSSPYKTSVEPYADKQRYWKIAVVLFIATLIYTVPATFFLDFIRDTEADRTLISMEMAQSSNWSVPRLLGQEFMTKPPGFYWAQAVSFLMTGSTKEWAARLPSALATAIMVTGLFLFLSKEESHENNGKSSLMAALILATSGAIFRLSIMAEIDMFFTLLVTLSLLSGYYTVTKTTVKDRCLWAIVFQTFSALAFLTKGPPVFLFSWLPIFVFFLIYSWKPNKKTLFHFATAHLAGLAVFGILTGLWIHSVVKELGQEKVMDHFNYQVVKRVTGEKGEHAGRNRGLFYYFGATAKGSIPWTPLLILFIYQRIKARKNHSASKLLPVEVFALSVIIPSFMGLTAVAGKASRYMLPLWPFFAILSANAIHNWKYSPLKKQQLISGIVILIVLLRIPWCLIYARGRNAKHSPRPIATSISELVPARKTIFILGLMERWTVYYLITEERRNVLRINSNVISSWDGNDDVYVFIHEDDEKWKLEELKTADTGTAVLKQYTQNKRNFQLIKTKASAIARLQTRPGFLGRK